MKCICLIFFLKLTFYIKASNKKFTRNFYVLNIINIKKFKKDFRLREGISYDFFTNMQVNKLSKVVPYDKYALDIYYKIHNKFKKIL
jgi:hypothetical protein